VSAPGRKSEPGIPVRVWDLPTRLFHWLLVALFAFSWWTAETERLDWHMLSGYGILALVLFRVYWGFTGSATARFVNFLKGPRAFLAYLARLFERQGTPTVGHNPMGGWSVAAFILLLLLQTGLGLFAIDVDGLNSGPLNILVSFETGRRIAGLHDRVFNLLLIVIGLHLAAMLFYGLYKRENLTAAMITGLKRLPRPAHPAVRFVPSWRAIPGLIGAGLIVAWLVLGHF
jgi:cytochrome b